LTGALVGSFYKGEKLREWKRKEAIYDVIVVFADTFSNEFNDFVAFFRMLFEFFCNSIMLYNQLFH